MTKRTARIFAIISFTILLAGITGVAILRNELVLPGKTNALYSLETARTKQRVIEVLEHWSNLRAQAWTLNTVDFLMPIGYTAFFFFSLLLLAPSFNFIRINFKWVMALAFIPGILDFVEGIATYVWLSGNVDAISPRIVYICSTLKFAIVIPFSLYIIACYALREKQKRRMIIVK